MKRYRLLLRGLVSVVVLLAIVFLVGCSSAQPQNIAIKGRLVAADNGVIPRHANAHVSLVEHGDQAGGDRIVAERSLHDIGKNPIQFKITAGRALLKSNGHYGLRAEILDASGNIRWATPLPVEVEPLKTQGVITLMLQPVDVAAKKAFKHYQCADDFQFAVAIETGQAVLRLGHRRVVLEARDGHSSRSPEVYADTHGNRLRVTGGSATLTQDGHTHIACVMSLMQSEKTGRQQGDVSAAEQGIGE